MSDHSSKWAFFFVQEAVHLSRPFLPWGTGSIAAAARGRQQTFTHLEIVVANLKVLMMWTMNQIRATNHISLMKQQASYDARDSCYERVAGFRSLEPIWRTYAATEGPKSWPVLVPGHKGSQQNPVQPIKCPSTNTFKSTASGWLCFLLLKSSQPFSDTFMLWISPSMVPPDSRWLRGYVMYICRVLEGGVFKKSG